MNAMTTLASFPSNIDIHGQNPNEHILLFVREHKIILALNLFLYTLILFFPQILRWLLLYIDQNILGSYLNLSSFFNSNWWTIIIIGWFSYVLTGYFNIFFHWFYNINMLSNQRFIDIDFVGIFDNKIETTSIREIQDVKDSQKGIFQSLFNMGDITVLTASGGTVFSLNNVPKAHKVRDFIMDVKVKYDRESKND
jgi:uncharacterized membrane protein YdbT with pleckstrin-like domain